MTDNDAPTIAMKLTPTRPDMTRHVRTCRTRKNATKTRQRRDTSRQVTTSDVDVYEHPYVKRLEAQVDKLEKKFDDQVRRTEEIQLRGQEKFSSCNE